MPACEIAGEAREDDGMQPQSHGLLTDRIVLVTAAAGTGIGSATARRCVEEGATVVISDRHARRLAGTAAELAELTGEAPLGIECDVTVEEQVQSMVDTVVDRY